MGATKQLMIGLSAVVCFAMGLSALAQTATVPATGTLAPAVFELATIRPTEEKTANSRFGFTSNFHFAAKNVPLTRVIKEAYDLNTGSEDQLLGAPSWTSVSRWDIEAKMDDALILAMQKGSKEEQIALARSMLRDLLAERFTLKAHREKRELHVNALTVGKDGPKLERFRDDPSVTGESNWRGLHMTGRGRLEARGIPLSLFTGMLASQPEVGGRLVIDQTALTERYTFRLEWTPEDGAGQREDRKDVPTLFTAMSEQLGLTMVSKKAPVDVLMVDSVQLPSGN